MQGNTGTENGRGPLARHLSLCFHTSLIYCILKTEWPLLKKSIHQVVFKEGQDLLGRVSLSVRLLGGVDCLCPGAERVSAGSVKLSNLGVRL